MSQAEPSAAKTATGNEITFPLDEFYRLAKRPLPVIESIDGQDVPRLTNRYSSTNGT